MKRVIKFRAWDMIGNRWLHPYPYGFHILGETSCFDQIMQQMRDTYPDRATLDMLNDVEIVQYIGMADKNGLDMYEGDFVRFIFNEGKHNEHSSIRKVIFEDTAFCFENLNAQLAHMKVVCGNFYAEAITHEVIGNIHENPELLKP